MATIFGGPPYELIALLLMFVLPGGLAWWWFRGGSRSWQVGATLISVILSWLGFALVLLAAGGLQSLREDQHNQPRTPK